MARTAQLVIELRQAYPNFQSPVPVQETNLIQPPWLHNQETRDPYFQGAFQLTPALSAIQIAYLQAFLSVQHSFWPLQYVQQQLDVVREAIGLPLGEDAVFFVGHHTNGLNGRNPFIDKHNMTSPGPGGQPHCGNCPWQVSDDGTQLLPDMKKLAAMPLKWLGWLVTSLLLPWNIDIRGTASYDDPCTSQEGKVFAEGSQQIWVEISQSGSVYKFPIIGSLDATDTAKQQSSSAMVPVGSGSKPMDKILLQSDFMLWSQRLSQGFEPSKLQLREGIAFSGLQPDPKSRWLGLEVDGHLLFFNGQTAVTRGLKRNQEYFAAVPDDVNKFFLATVQWAKDKPNVYMQAQEAYNAQKALRTRETQP